MKPQYLPEKSGIVNVSETSDLKDAFKELNDDSINSQGFSGIDLRARITPSQIAGLSGLTILSINGVYPKWTGLIGESVKRLGVSVRGQGRKESVDIAKGVRETEAMAGKSVIERSRE